MVHPSYNVSPKEDINRVLVNIIYYDVLGMYVLRRIFMSILDLEIVPCVVSYMESMILNILRKVSYQWHLFVLKKPDKCQF